MAEEKETKLSALEKAEAKAQAERPSQQAAAALNKGGVYIPPHKLREQLAKLSTDKKDPTWQRVQWDALRKSINGLINKVRGRRPFVCCN